MRPQTSFEDKPEQQTTSEKERASYERIEQI